MNLPDEPRWIAYCTVCCWSSSVATEGRADIKADEHEADTNHPAATTTEEE